MSPRPESAARLSEDIGDVLSAIRRLIAEDEALEYARDTLERQQEGRTGEPAVSYPPLTREQDGHAARARRMVAQGAAALSARTEDSAAQPKAPDSLPSSLGSRLVAADAAPTARGVGARLIARRDLPARRDHAVLSAPPLRLRESDRVITTFTEDVAARSHDDGPTQQAVHPQPMGTSRMDTAPQSAAGVEDEDGFAEAFDAKARMRPMADATLSIPVPPPAEAGEKADDGADANDGFWQVYAKTSDRQTAAELLTEDAEDDTWVGMGLNDGDVTREAGAFESLVDLGQGAEETDDQTAAMIADAPVVVALSIPGYPVEEIAEEPEAPHAAKPPADAVWPQVDPAARQEAAAADGTAPEVMVVDQPAKPADEQDQDEEAPIREVIRAMVQEELHGELGQRFSRNLRAVIRREVASAIDDHLERL